nr:methyltransferase domain-containing protein [uncultured Rhodopila sp.]
MQAIYYDADLLERIPLAARTVLFAGYGDGLLAAAYRRLNPKARLLGLDPDAEAAPPHLDAVAADLDADALPFDLPHGLDCIVYRGCLERARDPGALLRRHAAALSPDGVMVIHVPNTGHWRIAERLLRGEDAEAEADQPRGLTRESMRRHLLSAGLTLCDVIPHGSDEDGAAFAEALAPGLEALGIDPEEYALRAAPLYLTWRARKEPRPKVILSGNMLAPVGGVSHVRVVHPLRAIASDPSFRAELTAEVFPRGPGDDTPRIFVLHRPVLIGEKGLATIRALTAAGNLVVTEFDDHPDHFEMMRVAGNLTFRGVHALQTSTSAMAEVLRQYNPEIAVFPNAMAALPEVRNFAALPAITLFFGALNRERDWRPLMPVINGVASKTADRLRFQVVHDREFFEALETPHKTFTPTCDYETYLRLLGESEVSLMPLSDTPFNRAKSDLKFVEAAACRVASLASSVVYGDSIEDGRLGLLFRDPHEFHLRLLRLIALPELARDIGDAGRRYVAEHRMLACQVAPRIAWYRSLWARREALTEALRSRMATL